MTRDELKNRLVKINGKVMQDRILNAQKNRRGLNYIELQAQESEGIDDFFEYEKDLSAMESSSAIVARLNKLHGSVDSFDESTLPSQAAPQQIIITNDDINTSSYIVLEEEISTPQIIKDENLDYTEVKGFQFKYCQHKKEDGTNCKRQAPKNGNYCSSHKKLTNKE